MLRKHRKPVWLILCVFAVLVILVLVLEGGDRSLGWTNEVTGIGIVFFVLGAIALWVYLNTTALLDEEVERVKHGKLEITKDLPKQPPKESRNGDTKNDSVSYDARHINQVTHSRR